MNPWLKAKTAPYVAVLLTQTLLVCAAHAAEPVAPATMLDHVPADAAVIVSLRLAEVDDGFAFADLLSGLYPQVAQALTSIRAPLALPAFSESELSDRGLVPERPTFLSLYRVPTKLPRTSLGFAHRLVVAISDRPKFVAYAQSVLGRLKFASTTPGAKTAAWAKPLAGFAKKKSIALLGFDVATAQGVAVRFEASETDVFALVDVYVPDLAKPPGKKAASVYAAGMKAMLEQPTITSLSTVSTQGTRSTLGAKASIALVVQPEHMVKVLPPACQTPFASAAGAFFTDMAVSARLNPFDWKVRVSFAPTDATKPFILKGGNNDGLIDTRALADAGLGAASLFLDNAAAWLNVPRPTMLGKTWADTAKQWDTCGPASVAITIARFWPHLATGLFSETLDSLQAPDILKDARNLAIGVRIPMQMQAGPARTLTPLWLASLDTDKQNAIYKWLDRRSESAAENAAFGKRAPRLWTLAGPASEVRAKSAGVEPLPGTHIGLALSPEEDGLGWYYSEKRRPAVFSNRAAMGALHINIKRLLSIAAEASDVDTRDAVSLATSQISRMGGDLVANGGLLELDLSLSGGGL